MASLSILSAAVLLVLLLLVAWYARARAVGEARRLEAEGARGREIECIAMDAASLLAATLQSIETARRVAGSVPGETRMRFDEAASAAQALSALFSASRLYLQPENAIVTHGRAEGCVRVAIAIARSRGGGISVRGEQTTLQLRGRPRVACELVVEVLDACRATLRPGEFVEVQLSEDVVHVLGGTGGPLTLPGPRGTELGWSIEPNTVDGRAGASIRALAPDHDEDRRLESAGRPRLVH